MLYMKISDNECNGPYQHLFTHAHDELQTTSPRSPAEEGEGKWSCLVSSCSQDFKKRRSLAVAKMDKGDSWCLTDQKSGSQEMLKMSKSHPWDGRNSDIFSNIHRWLTMDIPNFLFIRWTSLLKITSSLTLRRETHHSHTQQCKTYHNISDVGVTNLSGANNYNTFHIQFKFQDLLKVLNVKHQKINVYLTLILTRFLLPCILSWASS